MNGERQGTCSVLVGKPEGKNPLGRPKRKCDDNMKLDLQRLGLAGKGGGHGLE